MRMVFCMYNILENQPSVKCRQSMFHVAGSVLYFGRWPQRFIYIYNGIIV